MTAFTPGPWTAFYKHKYDEWHVSVPCGQGTMKLDLFSDGIEGPHDDREANARLIAAAPDLLAALQEVVAIADWETDACDRAHTAIRKATTP